MSDSLSRLYPPVKKGGALPFPAPLFPFCQYSFRDIPPSTIFAELSHSCFIRGIHTLNFSSPSSHFASPSVGTFPSAQRWAIPSSYVSARRGVTRGDGVVEHTGETIVGTEATAAELGGLGHIRCTAGLGHMALGPSVEA